MNSLISIITWPVPTVRPNRIRSRLEAIFPLLIRLEILLLILSVTYM